MTILINRFLLFLFLLPVNESFGVVLISDSESSAASSQTRRCCSSARSTPLTDSDDSDSRDDDGTEDERFCEAEEWDGLKFPRTAACQEARLPCPRPEITVGFVVQRCGCGDTKWLPKPDTNNCVHKWVSELNEAIRNDDPAEEISRMFTNNLKETLRSGLYGGDITGSVDLSEELLPLARDQYSMLFDRDERSQKATAFTRDFGEAGDELLSEMAEQVWMGLGTEIRIAKASSLMSLLEQSAILMADFIYEKQKKMDFNNWALEVQIKKPPLPQSPVNDVPLGAIQPYSAIFPPGPRFSSPGPRTFSPQPFSDQPDLDQSYASEAQDQDEVQVRVLNPTVFAAPPPSLSPVHPTQSAPQPNQPISFSGFSLSPSMSLPSISVLETSMEAASLDDQPVGVSGFGGYGAIPRSRFNSPNRNPMRLGYYVFKSVGPLLTPQGSKIINSMVIGASVNNPKQSLQLPKNNPVTFTFYHIHKAHVENPQCVFWDTMSRSWSTRGCTMLRTSNESTDCSCDHLTSFAILMDVTGKLDMVLSAESATALNVISIVGCVISIVCLILCLIVFTCFRSLWNVRNTIHRNLCLCLLIAELVFVVGIDRTESKPLCCAIAVILHYFFLASFCWMLLEGYQLYLMLIQVFEPDNVKIIIYFLWAYGFPAVIVAVSAGVAWPSYGTPNYCWINVNSPTIWAFVGPITVVIVANIVFLAIALKVVMSVRTRDRSRTERLAGWLKGSATLLCLLGITWIFGYMMIVSQAEAVFAYIFTILNSIQGLFIFILHVLFNEKVRATLLRFFKTRLCVCCGLGVSEAGAAAYNSKSYLSSRQKILNMIRGSEATTGSNHNNSGLHHRSSDSSNATNGILNRSSKLSKNESFHDKEKCHSKKMNLPALSPVYLEFREKVHEDGAPNTAESTLQNDDSPKLNDAKCGGVDDEHPDCLSGAEYGGHFGADDGHFGADQGQFGADDDNDDHIEKFTNVTSRTESRKSATAAPVRRKKIPLGKTDSERSSQLQYSQKRNKVIVERF